MPRRETNNPTERILRLLDTWQELEGYLAELEHTLQRVAPSLWQKLPPRPSAEAFNLEAQRQQFTRLRTMRAREYQRRVRAAADGHDDRITSFKKLIVELPALSDERKAEIDALIADEARVRLEEDTLPRLSPQFDNQTSPQDTSGDADANAAAEGDFKL